MIRCVAKSITRMGKTEAMNPKILGYKSLTRILIMMVDECDMMLGLQFHTARQIFDCQKKGKSRGA